FSPDSKTLASKGRDRAVRLIDVETAKNLYQLGEPVGPALNPALARLAAFDSPDLAFSHDGKIVATGSGNTIRMWDTATGKELPLTGDGHRAAISTLMVAPDGKTGLSRGADNMVRRWDLATGEQLGHFREPAGAL